MAVMASVESVVLVVTLITAGVLYSHVTKKFPLTRQRFPSRPPPNSEGSTNATRSSRAPPSSHRQAPATRRRSRRPAPPAPVRQHLRRMGQAHAVGGRPLGLAVGPSGEVLACSRLPQTLQYHQHRNPRNSSGRRASTL